METIGRSGRHRLYWLSLNGDSPVGPQNRTRNDPIRVNSCPFVVFYCMDTAKGLKDRRRGEDEDDSRAIEQGNDTSGAKLDVRMFLLIAILTSLAHKVPGCS